MTVLPDIKYKRISAAMPSAIMLAWLSVVAIPCAMTPVSEAPGRVEASGPDSDDDCAGVNLLQSMVGPDCCSQLNSLVNVDAPKLPKVAMFILVPPNPVSIAPAIVNVLMIDPGHLPANDPFPPVYLATRRLRI